MSKEEGRAQDGNIPDSVSAEKSVAAVGELEAEAAAAEIDRLIRASESELDLEDDVDGGGEEEEEKEEKEEDEEEEEEGEEEEDELADLRFLDAVIVQDLNEAFQLFDVEDEGFINPKKLFGALRSLGYNPTEAEVQDLIESVDRDGNGEISLDEFMAMMRKRWNESLIEENSREAFCVFDADENDIISADDIAPLFTRLGHNLSQNQLQQVIAAADIDGDGTVTFEDFLAVFNRRPRDSARTSKVTIVPSTSVQEKIQDKI